MNAFNAAYRAFGWLKLAGAAISGVAIFGMMLFIVYDVVGRNLLGGSIRGGFEIVQNYFMPLSIFPALGYVYASGILPKMDMVMDRAPRRLQGGVIYLTLLAEIVIFSLLLYFTWDYAMAGMNRGMAFPAAGTLYKLWPLLFLVPFGMALVLVETMFALTHNVLNKDAPPSLDMVEPGERPDL